MKEKVNKVCDATFDFPVYANMDSTSEDDFQIYSDDSSENSSDDSLNDDDVIDVLTNSPVVKTKANQLKVQKCI